MVQQPAHSIIAELEDAVRGGSSARRVETLRQVTDLFLNDGERLSDDQVKVFDDVLCLLIARVETRARAELSKRLAPLDYAPFEVIQYLAWDDEIAVAGDVLTHSSRLSPEALVEIANIKGQQHLLAISARDNLPEAVTDVIVERGETRVIRRLAKNATARFSEAGYSGMVAHSEADDELVEILGLRLDLPVKFLRDLLRRANDAVRKPLLAMSPPPGKLAASGGHPQQPAGPAPDRQQTAGRRGARLKKTVDGNRHAHGSVLAVAQQDREVSPQPCPFGFLPFPAASSNALATSAT